MKSKTQKIITVYVSVAYVIWASIFIFRSSFIGIDNVRYFSLFDDAMISMRYAWHFSHGYGLVWNIGERVEGITNPLWTVWMSLGTLIFDKRIAVLFIHISGVFIMLGIAKITYAIAAKIANDNDSLDNSSWRALIAFILIFLYYPLSYWTLLGMETGLLSLLILASVSVVFKSGHEPKSSRLLFFLFCLAIWTRPDALIYVVPIMLYRFNMLLTSNCNQQASKINNTFRLVAIEIFLLVAIVALPVALRWLYYDELVPNTYTLKMTGMAVIDRLSNGIGFIWPFLITIIPMLLILMLDFKTLRAKNKFLLLILVFTSIAYQIWVGGDPWAYWRTMAPVMPLFFILCVDSMFNIARQPTKKEYINIKSARYAVIIFGGLPLIYAFANYKFLPEQYFLKSAYYTDYSRGNANVAIVTNELLTKNASLAVFVSGTTPYYSNFKAIDILGKSDKVIARLPPDMSGNISWAGMRSVPGHNKYNLHYSIINLKPTYVQSFKIGRDDLTEYAQKNYALVHYKGMALWLLAGSKDVLWDKIEF